MPLPYAEPVEIVTEPIPAQSPFIPADAKMVVGVVAPASPDPIPIVLLPGFEYRLREWRHPETHAIHCRLERRRPLATAKATSSRTTSRAERQVIRRRRVGGQLEQSPTPGWGHDLHDREAPLSEPTSGPNSEALLSDTEAAEVLQRGPVASRQTRVHKELPQAVVVRHGNGRLAILCSRHFDSFCVTLFAGNMRGEFTML